MHVEQPPRDLAGAQVVDLRQRLAPAVEPGLERRALRLVGADVDQQVDVARRPGVGVLRAAEQVDGDDAVLARVELRRQPLRHAEAPAPVVLLGAGPRLRRAHLRLARGGRRGGPLRGHAEERHRLVQLGVHQHAEHLPAGLGADVHDAHDVGEARRLGDEVAEDVPRAAQELLVVDDPLVVRVERQVADLRLDEVLEEVRAEGEVGDVVPLLARHLDQDRGVVDVGVGHRHAEADVAAASPAARADQRELALRQQLVEPPHDAADVAQRVRVGDLGVPLRIDEHEVGQVGHAAVRDVAPRGEEDLPVGQVARDPRRGVVGAVALRAALQQVEVLPVVGELDVHRRRHLLAQQRQQLAHAGHEGGVLHQAVEGEDQLVALEVEVRPDRAAHAVAVDDGDHLPHAGVLAADLAQELPRLHRLEGVRLEVDHVDPLRRVLERLVHGDVGAQPRLPGGDQHRIVVRHAVHGARAEPRDEPDQPVAALDPGRPAELVVVERHAGAGRHPVLADPLADDLLHEDAHLLVDVDQVALGAVLERVGTEDRGVDLGDRVHQRLDPRRLRPLVAEEQALVLAGEGRAGAVLEQAGAADDDRRLAEVVEREREPLGEDRREGGVLEQLHEVRVLLPHLLDLHVLAAEHVLEVVVVDEGVDAVGGDVPGLGDLDLLQQRARLGRVLDDLLGEEQAGALAAQLAVAARRHDDLADQAVEVVDVHRVLAGVDEVELVGEEAPGERGAQPLADRAREVRLVHVGVAVPLQRLGDLRERRVLVLQRGDEEARLLLLDPAREAGEDLRLAEVLAGDAERRLVEVEPAHLLARQRPVDVGRVVSLARHAAGGELQQLARLLHAGPAEVVDHLPRDPGEEPRVGAAEELEHDPPLALLGGRAAGERRLPAVERRAQPPLHQRLREPLGDGVDQLPLLLEERPLVGARHLLAVRDLDGADRLPLHDDLRRLRPDGVHVVRRLDHAVVDHDPRLADRGVLPARGQDGDDAAADLLDPEVAPGKQLVHAVEAVQLLRPLLQRAEDLLDLGPFGVHPASVVPVSRAARGRLPARAVRPRAGPAAPPGGRGACTAPPARRAARRATPSRSGAAPRGAP